MWKIKRHSQTDWIILLRVCVCVHGASCSSCHCDAQWLPPKSISVMLFTCGKQTQGCQTLRHGFCVQSVRGKLERSETSTWRSRQLRFDLWSNKNEPITYKIFRLVDRYTDIKCFFSERCSAPTSIQWAHRTVQVDDRLMSVGVRVVIRTGMGRLPLEMERVRIWRIEEHTTTRQHDLEAWRSNVQQVGGNRAVFF